MRLLSETLPDATPGPAFPKAYPEIDQDVLTESGKFTGGQPYDLFARLRAQAPVSWQREGQNGPGFWALTRYEDVMRVDGDPKTFSSQKGGILMAYGPPETRHPLLFRASVDAMINMDAPWHLQLRKEHMPYFTPAYLADLKKKVAADRRHGRARRVRPGRKAFRTAAAVHAERNPRRATIRPAEIHHLDALPGSCRLHHGEAEQGDAADAGPLEVRQGLQRERRRDVRIRPEHAAEAPRRSQAGPDERDRARHARRRVAAQRISRRIVALDRVRRQ